MFGHDLLLFYGAMILKRQYHRKTATSNNGNNLQLRAYLLVVYMSFNWVSSFFDKFYGVAPIFSCKIHNYVCNHQLLSARDLLLGDSEGVCGDSLDHICKLDFRRKCVSVVDYWLVVGPIPAVDCNAYGRLLMSISLHNVIAAVKLFNWHLLINYNVTKATATCVCVTYARRTCSRAWRPVCTCRRCSCSSTGLLWGSWKPNRLVMSVFFCVKNVEITFCCLEVCCVCVFTAIY